MMHLLMAGGQYPGGVGSGFFTGTYTGDGNATKAITGVGFAPGLIFVYPQVVMPGGWPPVSADGWGMKSDQDGLNYMGWDYTVDTKFRYTTDNVISLDADGFTVGDGTTLGVNWMNILGQDYGFACWGNGAVSFADGNYAGDGNVTQAIAGLGFQPRLVMMFTPDNPSGLSSNPIIAKTDQDGIYATTGRFGWGGFIYAEDHVVSLDADGFTVGDGSDSFGNMCNALGATYYWKAWR